MNIQRSSIPDVLVMRPRVFEDARGFFFESFNEREFAGATGLLPKFVQDNHSCSAQGVLRGLHYQLRRPQGKLIRVVRGTVFDVAVDLRKSSPTFTRWVGIELSAENRLQFWIPPGFAHGFLVLSESAELIYKTTEYYDPADECRIAWNDPRLDVQWPLGAQPVLSALDAAAARFDASPVFD
jgi:dTDP-4-dehydrorhamnose 3,5-epimerase